MNAQQVVKVAYRKLKQNIYHDKTNLFLRQRIAEFECDPDFDLRMSFVVDVIQSETPASHEVFKTWLAQIGFRLYPKSATQCGIPPNEEGRFISNVTSGTAYDVERVNYFFDGPVELHLIATAWLIIQGVWLDKSLSRHCYGARLHPRLLEHDDNTSQIFIKYHEKYAQWRDRGLKIASRLLKEDRQSVFMLSLDIQEYFYRIRLDYGALKTSLGEQSKQIMPNGKGNQLLDCLEAIGRMHRHRINAMLRQTHGKLGEEDIGLPIGLLTSPVLANWYLHEFDTQVCERVRPAYYGRYVDDIFLVIASDASNDAREPVGAFIKRIFVETNMFRVIGRDRYEIIMPGKLYLQQEKCVLQHFDSSHSIAGLENFQRKLEENVSDFQYLPGEGDDSPVGEVAYDILYEGSVNKLRSVKGVGENKFALAKHLARQNQLNLLTSEPASYETAVELLNFFRGVNTIKFYDLWERVLIYYMISKVKGMTDRFLWNTKEEIAKIKHKKKSSVTRRIQKDLLEYLKCAGELTDALGLDVSDVAIWGEEFADIWRKSNLIRHHLVAFPLLNYTKYSKSLLEAPRERQLELDERLVQLSPRYVHFDECLMYLSGQSLTLDVSLFERAMAIFERFNGFRMEGVTVSDAQVSERKGK